jgi:hypothetical protein
MALKRYIGPADAVEVRLMGEPYGLVEHGETLVVPDDLAAALAWPESHWEDVKPASRKEVK